ncbi:hypothetical protein [Haladaptatus sp. CMSO5]|uniref:hypothetical protein n=1 Tax=Haladaptatus sp. CMSO5 TaxID=3120514 RepID=UPI002FCDFABB
MTETDTRVPVSRDGLPDVEFSIPVLVGASTVGVLVNLNALIIPILGIVGGGVLAGFVAAYAAGGGVRGLAHGLVVGAITGFAGGLVVILIGSLIGLYSEPPSVLLNAVGPVSPWYDHMGGTGHLLILLTILVFIALESVGGAFVGAAVRRAVDRVLGR